MEINDKMRSYPIGAPVTKPTFEAAERIENKEAQNEQRTGGTGPSDQHAVVSISRASREA
jgi:hypothetical protein